MSNCKKFGYLSVDNIVPGSSGLITVGPGLAGSAHIANVTWKNYTATGTIAAVDLIGLGIGNTGATGAIVMTLPSAASVIAAFADAGINVVAGMTFVVMVSAFAAFTNTITASTTITFDNARTTVAVASGKCASLMFRVASIVSGSESIVVDSIASN